MCHTSSFYGRWAYNMAHSIKALCSMPIHLVHDKESIEDIDLSIFDSHSEAEFSKDFCLEKLRIYDHSPFDETLYLDVDGISVKNPEEIFAKLKGSIVWTQPMGTGKKGDDTINYMWAKNDLIYEKFNIPEEALFTTTQTSIIYFTKEAEGFFNQLKINYDKRLKPIEYREMWGKSKQHPDELYYSITMAQMGIRLQEFKPVFFPEKVIPVEDIMSNYYILSMYGGNNVRPYAKNLYDRIMQNNLNAKGKNHYFKADRLYKNKFINIK